MVWTAITGARAGGDTGKLTLDIIDGNFMFSIYQCLKGQKQKFSKKHGILSSKNSEMC